MLTPRIIIPLCVGLVALFLAQQFVLPLWKEVQALHDERSQAEHTLEDLRTRYEERGRIFDAWRALDEDKKERVLLAVPGDVDTPNLLVFLDRAIQENGLLSGQIQIGAPQVPSSPSAIPAQAFQGTSATQGGGGFVHIPITLGASGEYASIKAFFVRVERHLRILNPDNFSLRVQRDEDGEVSLDAQIVLNAYQLPN